MPTASKTNNKFVNGSFTIIGSKPVPKPEVSLPMTDANPVDSENLAKESAAENVSLLTMR